MSDLGAERTAAIHEILAGRGANYSCHALRGDLVTKGRTRVVAYVALYRMAHGALQIAFACRPNGGITREQAVQDLLAFGASAGEGMAGFVFPSTIHPGATVIGWMETEDMANSVAVSVAAIVATTDRLPVAFVAYIADESGGDVRIFFCHPSIAPPARLWSLLVAHAESGEAW